VSALQYKSLDVCGHAWRGAGASDKVTAAFSKCVDLSAVQSKQWKEAQMNIACTFYDAGDIERAEKAFESLLAVLSSHSEEQQILQQVVVNLAGIKSEKGLKHGGGEPLSAHHAA
jgi:hypothetical protein